MRFEPRKALDCTEQNDAKSANPKTSTSVFFRLLFLYFIVSHTLL